MAITLVIKGAPTEAREAMAARGVKAIRELSPMGRDSRAVVGDCHLMAVVQWFCEAVDGEGAYPPGTLLFYTHP